MPKVVRTDPSKSQSRKPDPLLPPGYVRREVAIQQNGVAKLLASLAMGERRAVLFVHDGPSPHTLPIPHNYWQGSDGQITLTWGSATDQPIQFELASLFHALDTRARRQFPNDPVAHRRDVAEWRTRIGQMQRARPPAAQAITLANKRGSDWPQDRAGCVIFKGIVLIEEIAPASKPRSEADALRPAPVVRSPAPYDRVKLAEGARQIIRSHKPFRSYTQLAIAVQDWAEKAGIAYPPGSPQRPFGNEGGTSGAKYIVDELLCFGDSKSWPELAYLQNRPKRNSANRN